MISAIDVIAEFISGYNWSIVDVLNASETVQLVNIKRSRTGDKINTYDCAKYIRLNLIIKEDTAMVILNPDKATDYRVGDLSLNDPNSLDVFGNILS